MNKDNSTHAATNYMNTGKCKKLIFLYTIFMKIHPIVANNPLQNIFYILEYWEKQALLIDPSDSQLAQKVLDEHDLKLQKIFITHEHYDHYDGVEWLDCDEVYAGKLASENIPFSVKHIFQNEEIVFEHEDIQIQAISTPGHADGHMMFEVSKFVEDAGMRPEVIAIFSGDALFQWWVGHTRRGGTEILYESLRKFHKYSDEVMIYSGHDYLETNSRFLKKYTPENTSEIDKILTEKWGILDFTTLWEERKYNPFLTVNREEFIRLRELRNNF